MARAEFSFGCPAYGSFLSMRAVVIYYKYMAKTDYQSIDDYIAAFAPETQTKLQEIRAILHDALPDAQETISYQIPCFKNDGPVAYFSAFAKHLTLAVPPPTIDHFQNELTEYKTSKSVVQLPYDKPLPKTLIRKMVKWREAENLKTAKGSA